MVVRNESESLGLLNRLSCSDFQMDQQGRPNEPQLVYRRDLETGQPVEGHLRWGLIPHFCGKRPDFAPIHARAETVAVNEWFSDAYRRRRCIVPMNSFFSEGRRRQTARDLPTRRPALRRRRHMGKLARFHDEPMGAYLCRHHSAGERTHRSDPRAHAGDTAERPVSALAQRRSGSARPAGAAPRGPACSLAATVATLVWKRACRPHVGFPFLARNRYARLGRRCPIGGSADVRRRGLQGSF